MMKRTGLFLLMTGLVAMSWSVAAAENTQASPTGAQPGIPVVPFEDFAVPLRSAEAQPVPRDGRSDTFSIRPVEGQPGMFSVQSQPKMIKAAYLGVTTKPISPELTAQLDLPKGIGLTVTFVGDESPAAKAGLRAHDVLHKLGDQLLVNADQLRVLVRTYQPGNTVKLTVLRGGKSQVLEAKLIEKQVPELVPGGMQMPRIFRFEPGAAIQPGMPAGEGLEPGREGLDWQPMPENQLDENMRRQLDQLRQQQGDIDAMRQRLEQMMRDLERGHDQLSLRPGEMRRFPLQPGEGGQQRQFRFNLQPGAMANMQLKWQDDEHVLELQRQGDEPGKLTVKTRDGEVVYEGDMPAEGAMDDIPESVRPKVEKLREMSQNNTMRFEMLPQGALPSRDLPDDLPGAPRLD